MNTRREGGDWHLRALWVAGALLPPEMRKDKFFEWRDELQCAREHGLSAGRRTISIMFRSIPRLAWRARRPRGSGRDIAKSVRKRLLPDLGTERRFSRFLVMVVAPLVVLALGLITFTFDLTFNDAPVHFTNAELSRVRSPAWLFRATELIGLGALVTLLWVSAPATRQYQMTKRRTATIRAGSCAVLVAALLGKMVAFGQYSAVLYLAIAATVVLFLASLTGLSSQQDSFSSDRRTP